MLHREDNNNILYEKLEAH